MPHYADGTLAQLGDKVKGKPYNTPHEVVGEVIQVTPGSDHCNLIVAFADVLEAPEAERGLYGNCFANGKVFTTITVARPLPEGAAGQNLAPNPNTTLQIVPKFDYGETGAFTKIA